MKKAILLIMVLALAAGILVQACSQAPAPAPVPTPAPAPAPTPTLAPSQAEPIEWRFWTTAGVNNVEFIPVSQMAGEITQNSKGRLVITPYPGEALGYQQADIPRVLQRDGIEMVVCTVNNWAGDDPLCDLSILPYLAPNPEKVPALLEAIQPMYDQHVFPKWNAKSLGTWAIPLNSLAAAKEVDTVEKWEGIKIRGCVSSQRNGTLFLSNTLA